MHTMHPVIVSGSYRLDPELLPQDEFEERLRAVRAIMRREGYHGLVVHGDAQDSAMLTWLTNAYPRLRFQLALIGLEGEPSLLAAGSTRDLPAAAALTWCRSFGSFGDAPRLLAAWHDRISAGLGPGGRPTVAVHGLSRMRRAVRTVLQRAWGDGFVEATRTFDPLLVAKRWRELAVLREAHGLLERTVQVLRAAWSVGKPVKVAVLEAEHAARRAQAQDVRILFSLDAGATLRPFESMSDERRPHAVCYVAVRYLGYWAQAYVCEGLQESLAYRAAAARLQALRAHVQPGLPGSALARALPEPPTGCRVHPMLGEHLAHGAGLGLQEPPSITALSDEGFREGGVYVLQAGFTGPVGEGALLSRTVSVVDGRVCDLETITALQPTA